MIKKIAFTVYPVSDMARARKFYEEALGMTKAEDYGGQWVEYDLAGGCFAITTMFAGSIEPSSTAGGNIAFEVEDVERFTASLRLKGVQVKLDPMTTPVCRLSVILDPDGNAITLHQVTD